MWIDLSSLSEGRQTTLNCVIFKRQWIINRSTEHLIIRGVSMMSSDYLYQELWHLTRRSLACWSPWFFECLHGAKGAENSRHLEKWSAPAPERAMTWVQREGRIFQVIVTVIPFIEPEGDRHHGASWGERTKFPAHEAMFRIHKIIIMSAWCQFKNIWTLLTLVPRLKSDRRGGINLIHVD